MNPLTAAEVTARCRLAELMYADDTLYERVTAATEAEYAAYHHAVDSGDMAEIDKAKVVLVRAELAAYRKITEA